MNNSSLEGANASPQSHFSSFGLPASLLSAIEHVGYTTPTPIQAAAIPKAMIGTDLMGLAQTGTGKTAAFILPIIHRLLANPKRGIRALIVAPTRELVDQIQEVFAGLSRGTNLRSAVIYGGVSYGRQHESLRRDPHIVIACPGRLLDHLTKRSIALSGVEMLVLDEADRMFDMGFLPTIRRIVKTLPKERQTMLFSATMPPEIETLARELLRSPEVIRVKSEVPVAKISHAAFSVVDGGKQELLQSWLGENQDSIVVVFTRMKHTAKRLHQRLSAAGHPATSLHGNLSQGRRQEALAGFRTGSYRILVATDIAARGIDVEGVSHVINYDMPENLESYIHRVGRAGRASRSGAAVSFVTREDQPLVRSIERWLKSPLKVVGHAPRASSRTLERDDRSPSVRSNGPRSEGRRSFSTSRRPSSPSGSRTSGENRREEEPQRPRRHQRPGRHTGRGAR